MTGSTKEVLQRARARIADPINRCLGAYAEDAQGQRVLFASSGAVRFCAIGAVMAETDYLAADLRSDQRPLSLLREAAQSLFGRSVATVNDKMEHADVLRMYDHAIDQAE